MLENNGSSRLQRLLRNQGFMKPKDSYSGYKLSTHNYALQLARARQNQKIPKTKDKQRLQKNIKAGDFKQNPWSFYTLQEATGLIYPPM